MTSLFAANLPDFHVHRSVDSSPKQKDFQMHVHSQNEILFFISGEASYLVEGHEYPLTQGSLMFIREGESHALNLHGSAPYERIVVNFASSFFSGVDPDKRLLAPFYDRRLGTNNLYNPDFSQTLNLLENICRPYEDDYELRLNALSNLLPLLSSLRGIFLSGNNIPAEQSPLAVEILAYVNRHLFEPLTVDTVAKRFYLSRSQVERIIKRHSHSSLWHYIIVKRLAAAKAMIESGTPASVAAISCGFGDYSSFYRAYIKEFSSPPSAK